MSIFQFHFIFATNKATWVFYLIFNFSIICTMWKVKDYPSELSNQKG